MPRGVPNPKRPGAYTPRKKRAVELFKQNMLGKGTKSIEEILLAAGYSKNSARQQMNVLEGIKPHLQTFIDEMIVHREEVLKRMKKRVGKANYADLVRALDILTHNIQLLGGKPTQNVLLNDDRRKELDHLIDD